MRRLLAAAPLLALVLAQTWTAHAQDSETPKKETVRSFTLKVDGDGRVEMKVGDKTYAADSMEEFRKKYPELAREYKVDRMLRPDFHDLARPFEDWKKVFGEHGFGDLDPELRKLLENPGAFLEQHRGARPAPGGDAPTANPWRLGVRLAPIGETLADQLGLPAGKGAQIVEVEDGSAAAKAGLKKHDVLLAVDGKETDGVDAVRQAVVEALKKKDFALDLLRQGKKQTLKVESPS